MEEFTSEPTSSANLKDSIFILTHELNILTTTNPDVDFDKLVSAVGSLIQSVDDINLESQTSSSLFDTSCNEIAVLTSKLEFEKELRHKELINSYALKDAIKVEMIELKK
uniref:Uncharacterized protein n=1 Tax=Graphocephala atropunctata TaxID=36148 RepID=A0A1B6MEC0_9HEMI